MDKSLADNSFHYEIPT